MGRILIEPAVGLLFADSSKNASDMKSRQWTATNSGVLAIMALATLAHSNTIRHLVAILLMFLITVCHGIVTGRCETNLNVFRDRIRTLIECYFPEESHKLQREGF